MSPDITSAANDHIKWLVRLRERRHRDEESVFLVEGERLYRRALNAGLDPDLTFLDPAAQIETEGETITVAAAALDRASYRQRSQGVIGVFPQIDTRLSSLSLPEQPLLLVAEAVEKPGNLGAMLRTVAAAGADGLVTVGTGTDPFNPNAIRASTGALFTVPLAVTDWDELEPWLDAREVGLLCATTDADVSLWDADLSGAVALVVGAEARGLSERASAVADRPIRIPQAPGTVDSLNVSVAAAVLLFEARRQRERG